MKIPGADDSTCLIYCMMSATIESMQRSAIAAINNDGFEIVGPGIIEPSTAYSPS